LQSDDIDERLRRLEELAKYLTCAVNHTVVCDASPAIYFGYDAHVWCWRDSQTDVLVAEEPTMIQNNVLPVLSVSGYNKTLLSKRLTYKNGSSGVVSLFFQHPVTNQKIRVTPETIKINDLVTAAGQNWVDDLRELVTGPLSGNLEPVRYLMGFVPEVEALSWGSDLFWKKPDPRAAVPYDTYPQVSYEGKSEIDLWKKLQKVPFCSANDVLAHVENLKEHEPKLFYCTTRDLACVSSKYVLPRGGSSDEDSSSDESSDED
jgi:hypothetical protein